MSSPRRVPDKAELRAARLGPAWVRSLSRMPLGLGAASARAYGAYFDASMRRESARTNRPAEASFAAHQPGLDGTQGQLLADLQARGVARVSVNALLPAVDFAGLRDATERWLATGDVASREHAYLSGESRRWKDYIVRLYGRDAEVPWDSPWLQFGLERRLLDIVNTYFGLWTKLLYVDVWNTLALDHEGPDMGSQRWHRDPEDSRLVKAFLYLNDVNDEAGPMEYVPESRRGDRYGHLWPQEFPGGSVPPPGAVEAAIPARDQLRCTGAAGTLLLVDTTGLHRGGRATRHRRLLATWTYATPAALWPRAFTVSGAPPLDPDRDASSFALI